MSTTTSKSEFLLLFRDTNWDKDLTPEKIQAVMDRVNAWLSGLEQKGIMKGGQPLDEASRTVSVKSGRVVADGPFAEAKEVVGGYILIDAADMDEAVAIAKSCPTLQVGSSIEVRPTRTSCPITERLKQRLAEVAA